LPNAGLLASPAPNLVLGTATVTVNAGGLTIVTFTDALPAGIPALSTWAMIGLAALMLAFGVWKLNARRTT
jgi:hypothetical protein